MSSPKSLRARISTRFAAEARPPGRASDRPARSRSGSLPNGAKRPVNNPSASALALSPEDGPSTVSGTALDQPAQLGDQAGQAPASNIPHREIWDVGHLAHRMHRHNVRVLEQAGDLRLELESGQGPSIHRRGLGQELERHSPVEGDLTRLIDDAHPAPADLADDPKVAKNPAHAGIARTGFGNFGVAVANLPERREPAQGGQQFSDLTGMGRVFRGELLDVDRFTRLDPRRAVREQRDQLGVHRDQVR